MANPSGRTERFLETSVRVQDPEASLKFYREFLGMDLLVSEARVKTPWEKADRFCVGYSPASHLVPGTMVPGLKLIPVQSGEEKPKIEQWEGRFAVCLPAEDVKKVYAKFAAERPDLIVHDNGKGGVRELQEKLGSLYIFIAKDLDGYELCIVSRESLLPAVVEAGNAWGEQKVEYEFRQRFQEEMEQKGRKCGAF